tara:strand:+ start:1128 stop:2063 length:936 start_codon:yes stop_codon:yes gene_type:complete
MKTILQRTIKDRETNLYPVWLMRQAGRYMPEYMQMKQNSNGFLDMALTPSKAKEITMQPIKAFDMDAAIIFSDILIIPYALGQELDYTPAPVLGPFYDKMFETDMITFIERCQPVYDAIKQTRQELDSSKSLIGFAGAPYTLCKYMTQTKDQNVVDKLVPYIVEHLVQQIKAGCDTIQIFDSWAGDLTEEELDTLCYFPTAHIVSDIRELYPEVSIIAFPRLIGKNINDFANVVIPDCINLSDDIPVEDVTTKLVLQGGIPINELLVNGDITPMLQKMKDKPYVVNLAHGVNKETPVENVRNFVQTVKDFR